jgi:hypothetical protein
MSFNPFNARISESFVAVRAPPLVKVSEMLFFHMFVQSTESFKLCARSTMQKSHM